MHHMGGQGARAGQEWVRAFPLSGGQSHRHREDECLNARGEGMGAMPRAAGGGDVLARAGGQNDGSDVGTQPRRGQGESSTCKGSESCERLPATPLQELSKTAPIWR